MKIGYFTERPERWVPEEVILRNRRALRRVE